MQLNLAHTLISSLIETSKHRNQASTFPKNIFYCNDTIPVQNSSTIVQDRPLAALHRQSFVQKSISTVQNTIPTAQDCPCAVQNRLITVQNSPISAENTLVSAKNSPVFAPIHYLNGSFSISIH